MQLISSLHTLKSGNSSTLFALNNDPRRTPSLAEEPSAEDNILHPILRHPAETRTQNYGKLIHQSVVARNENAVRLELTGTRHRHQPLKCPADTVMATGPFVARGETRTPERAHMSDDEAVAPLLYHI